MEDENLVVDKSNLPASESEKAMTKEQITELVKHEKAKAAESVRRELESKHAMELEKLRGTPNQGLGGVKEVDEDKIYKNVTAKLQADAEEAEKERAAAEHDVAMRKLSASYFEKLAKGGEKYNDFDEIMKGFKHHAFPQIVYLVADKENTADIMYELAKNPQKLAVVNMWAEKDPERAAAELDKLSESISQNESAAQEYQPTNPPISQIKQSNVGMNNGKMSLEDFKKAEWNRF